MRAASPYLTPKSLALAAAVIFVVLLGPFLNLSSVGGSSEAREIHVAALVKETGEWVLPLRNGVVPSKPILFHWVTALLGELRGGVTPAVARTSSLLFGAATVALTVFLGALLGGLRSPALGVWVGGVSGFILASTYGFIQLALDARVDMTYAFFVVVAVSAVILPFLRPDGASRLLPVRGGDWCLFYTACGFAVLAKGPIGLVLPGLVGFACVAYLIGLRHALRVFVQPRWGWLLFLGLALPWYIAAAGRGADAFIERHLFFENLQRFTGAEHMNNEPPWFYFGSILRGALPWSILAVVFVVTGWPRIGRLPYGQLGGLQVRLRWVGALWFVTGFAFLSLAAGKRHSYLLPLYPGMAIFVGYHLTEWFQELSDRAQGRWREALRRLSGVLALLVVVIGVSVSIFMVLDLSLYPLLVIVQRWAVEHRSGLVLAVVIAVALQYGQLFSQQDAPARRVVSAALTVVWLLGFATTIGYGIKSEFKGFDRMATVVRGLVPSDTPLVLLKTRYNEYFDPFLYYLGRSVEIVSPQPSEVHCPSKTVYLARRDWFDAEMGEAASRVEEVTTVYQRYDEFAGRTDRGITLFKCRTGM